MTHAVTACLRIPPSAAYQLCLFLRFALHHSPLPLPSCTHARTHATCFSFGDRKKNEKQWLEQFFLAATNPCPHFKTSCLIHSVMQQTITQAACTPSSKANLARTLGSTAVNRTAADWGGFWGRQGGSRRMCVSNFNKEVEYS